MTKSEKRKYNERAFKLRVLAMSKGLTNIIIAEALNISDDTVSRCLRGERPAQFDNIKKFVREYRRKKAA